MRFATGACAFVVSAWVAALASAAPFTTHFDPLVAELTARRAEDYTGRLTRAQRKQVKAIDASLARLGGAHADLVADLKSAAFVLKKLVPAFPAEFDDPPSGDLSVPVASLLAGLVADVEAQYGMLDAALAGVTDPATRTAVNAKLTAARTALDAAAAPGVSPKVAAKQLDKAARAVLAGLGVVEREPHGRFTARIGTRAFVAQEIRASLLPGFFLSIEATAGQETIVIAVRPPAMGATTLTGFSPFGGSYALYRKGGPESENVWYTGEGTVTLTALDGDAPHIAGTFEFTAYNVPSPKVVVKSGSFDVTELAGP